MTYSHAPAKSLTSLFVLLLAFSSFSFAQTFSDPGFSAQLVTTLPAYKAVGLTFTPDGRMLVWQENGIVRVHKNGVLLTTPFLDISARVNIVGDRGLLGLTLDPNFATNGYVYLLYTYEPGTNPNDVAPRTQRLTRMRVDPANPDVVLPNSETILLGSLSTTPCADNSDCIGNDSDSHTGGTIRFGPDGKLYVSTGDGASYSFEDPLALRSQNLNSLSGKILRINPDGTAPGDNPFYNGNPNAVRSKVYSYGLRNPYRFAIHPTTGEVLIGNVGWVTYEEIERGRGANFGWPCYEGDAPQASYQARFPAQCGAIPASAITKPLHFYGRSEGVAVIGGAVYSATQFPVAYRGNFFFADYVGKWIRRMIFDASGNVSSVQTFATNVTDVVSLEQSPDGALYYISLASGEVRRIRFASAPTAVAAANPTVGISPLTVTFSSAGSSDPNNLSLTYLWEFGDSTTSTQANPIHTYTAATFTTFTAKLTVTNSQNASSSATVNVNVGNRAPTATITAPANNTLARPGDTITYSGAASDPDEALTGNAMNWQVLLHHDDHIHPYQSVGGLGGSFVVEDHGVGTYYYEIILTVTDSRGATDREAVNVNIASNPTTPITTYLSDLNWISATNGWGPVEKDRSNGEQGATDGRTITLNGVTYTKGLGVHAVSDVRFALNGAYKTFLSDIGLDDEVGGNGSVIFQVYADGALLYDSGTMLGSSATKQVNVDVTGKNELRLVVTIAGDNDWYDHADWANARLQNGAVIANAPPTVSLIAPSNNTAFIAPATVTLSANAADSDGTISKVEFYQGATLLGTATTSPYSFAWANVTAGNYSLTAKAFDDKGAAATSSAVSIAVNNNAAPLVSLTSLAPNTVLTAPANVTLTATASDSDGTISKVEFFSGSTVLGSATTAPFSFNWSNIAAGNYSLTAKATDNRGATATSSAINLTVNAPPTTGLPVPWQNQDVGAVGVAGSTGFASGVFTLKGSGADIWESNDGFQFAWQPLSRDGEIVARVVSVGNTDPWAKAGVMIRSSLAANAPYAMTMVTPGRGAGYQWRYFVNGNTGSVTNNSLRVPYWVKLVRQGNSLSGYTSPDGTTWTLVRVEAIPNMPGTVYVGLVVSAHNNGALSTATFDNVIVR
jgi:glucose/arabinose dehydrogenase